MITTTVFTARATGLTVLAGKPPAGLSPGQVNRMPRVAPTIAMSRPAQPKAPVGRVGPGTWTRKQRP